jgi:hypothetical protein
VEAEHRAPHRVGVIGLGNVLMGDDAFGPWVVQTLLAEHDFPEGIAVEDLGTPGLWKPSSSWTRSAPTPPPARSCCIDGTSC